MSVECTPPSLASISSSPSPLPLKLCPMSVHRSVQKLEFYCIISRLMPISYARSILWRAVKSLSVECTPPTLVFISFSPSYLSVYLCRMCVHQSLQELKFYSLVTRLKPISYTMCIIGRAVDLRPSDAHPQLWCLSAPLHYLCLLNFVP